MQSSRAAEPDLSRSELVKLVEDNTGVPGRLVSLALAYWAAYSEEIDALVALRGAARGRDAARSREDRAAARPVTVRRLLLDEMMSAKIAEQLRERGLDVQVCP